MNVFAVLTNRKRAMIALVHSVVFLGLRCMVLRRRKPPSRFTVPEAAVGITVIAIYLTVVSILSWLAQALPLDMSCSGGNTMNLIPLNLG